MRAACDANGDSVGAYRIGEGNVREREHLEGLGLYWRIKLGVLQKLKSGKHAICAHICLTPFCITRI